MHSPNPEGMSMSHTYTEKTIRRLVNGDDSNTPLDEDLDCSMVLIPNGYELRSLHILHGMEVVQAIEVLPRGEQGYKHVVFRLRDPRVPFKIEFGASLFPPQVNTSGESPE